MTHHVVIGPGAAHPGEVYCIVWAAVPWVGNRGDICAPDFSSVAAAAHEGGREEALQRGAVVQVPPHAPRLQLGLSACRARDGGAGAKARWGAGRRRGEGACKGEVRQPECEIVWCQVSSAVHVHLGELPAAPQLLRAAPEAPLEEGAKPPSQYMRAAPAHLAPLLA